MGKILISKDLSQLLGLKNQLFSKENPARKAGFSVSIHYNFSFLRKV